MVFHLGTLMPLAREAPPSLQLPPLTGGRRSYHFSAFLYPQYQQRSLRFACRCRRYHGLTLFRMNFRAGRTLLLRRRSFCP